MPAALVVDPRVIENLRALSPGDNDEFLRELTGLFFDDVPQRLAELDKSLAAGDQTTFARAVHSIKGSSANLGALALQASAEQLENSARLNGLVDVAPLIEDVRSTFLRTRTALSELTK